MNAHRTATKASDQAERSDSDRRKRARVNAWVLALLVLAFYIGFIAVSAVRSFTG